MLLALRQALLSPEVMVGIAEIDGQPRSFCLQRVRLYPGKLPDQRGFAVIDMTGGRNDQLPGITGVRLGGASLMR